ncbi:thiamine pyrophosphate-binding protein [Tumebacillus permanentifrigoris]|uniref:Pyruvate dehydrogenase (Quinone)/pyruvate oxidase n=1 Tax=Tumebacillus permanentifrigoris TaxID=378543 RepID=A0A316D5Y9_9BACL|nr:thiamine pyrophosphate-binding protein [Tumebacillus permanentifrigoris]PWK09593.1 pyruvate dehydrogenase (quinone)/pyruvate oxidase [Tumebacillus permanentifrigoris]
MNPQQTKPTQQTMTVAHTIVQQLQAWGVSRIYGVVGDTFLDFLDAINGSGLQFIAVKHESTAAFMASAEAKLTGKLGVCLATSGPGMANLLNGLGDAYQDKAPVLAITGQVPTPQIGTDTKQYLDQQVFIAPLAAYSALLTSPDATVEVFAKAIHTSLEQGAVTHVSVPKDLFTQQQSTPIRTQPHLMRGTMQVNPADIQQVAQLLQSAQKPVVVAGVGARAAAQDVVHICEALGAGLILSLGAKGMIDESNPHLLGGIGKGGSPYASELLKQADVVLLAGDTWWPQDYVPENVRIVQVDYAATNIGTKFNVELGLVGDTKVILPALAQQLQGHQPNQQWLSQIQQARQKWYAELEQEASMEGTPIHPARLIRALERTVQPDAVLCVDTGDHTVWFNRQFRGQQQDVLFSGTWRSMGFGLPAAMAAQLSAPNRQVVALVGDGCLGMSLADLSTAARYALPITVVVVNNGHLQMETDRQKVGQHTELGSDLTNPDFVKVAEACGVAGFRVTDTVDLDSVLQQAMSLPGPALIDVSVSDVMFPNTTAQEA